MKRGVRRIRGVEKKNTASNSGRHIAPSTAYMTSNVRTGLVSCAYAEMMMSSELEQSDDMKGVGADGSERVVRLLRGRQLSYKVCHPNSGCKSHLYCVDTLQKTLTLSAVNGVGYPRRRAFSV
jgi:hypothetical protein